MPQRNRIESLQTHAYMDKWFLLKAQRQISTERLSFQKCCITTGYPNSKTNNMNPYFMLYMRINSEWTIDLNVKPKSIKLLEANKEKKFIVTLGQTKMS